MRRIVVLILAAGLITGCAAETVTPSPMPAPPTSAPTPTPGASRDATPAPSFGPSPTGSGEPVAGTPRPTAPSANLLPARGSAYNVDNTRMAAGRDGVLFVSVGRRSGSILAALGPGGRPMAGWPIVIAGTSACYGLLPVADGGVRITCDVTRPTGDPDGDELAFAFAADGRPLAGWPVPVQSLPARVVGTDLVTLLRESVDNPQDPDVAAQRVRVVRTLADGTRHVGKASTIPECCGAWVIGPEGDAYTAITEAWSGDPANPPRRSAVHGVDEDGVLAHGSWPITLAGLAAGPTLGPDGRVVLTVGSAEAPGGVVRALDGQSGASAGVSHVLPMAMVDVGEVDCATTWPEAPVVDAEGRVFVVVGGRIHGLTPSLTTRDGWPVRIPGSLETPGISEGGLDCFSAVPPVPDGRGGVFLLLAARTDGVGGRIVDVDEAGVRQGWPVELRRPGSTFWSAVVGDDGTAYALAVEPEGSRTWSATILAMAPDSTVRWRATILEP